MVAGWSHRAHTIWRPNEGRNPNSWMIFVNLEPYTPSSIPICCGASGWNFGHVSKQWSCMVDIRVCAPVQCGAGCNREGIGGEGGVLVAVDILWCHVCNRSEAVVISPLTGVRPIGGTAHRWEVIMGLSCRGEREKGNEKLYGEIIRSKNVKPGDLQYSGRKGALRECSWPSYILIAVNFVPSIYCEHDVDKLFFRAVSWLKQSNTPTSVLLWFQNRL